MNAHGIVLLGHGARDPRWGEPFARVADKLRASATPDASARAVAVAFLDLMAPALPEAIDALVAQGCDTITVVPLFIGQGGHVRRDLPRLIDACRTTHPNLSLRCAPSIGDDDAVLDAIAAYCIAQAAHDAE